MTLSREMVERFMAIASALSPENLMADGERSRDAAVRIKQSLAARWLALEAEVGRSVTDDEVWGAFMASRERGRGRATTTYSCW
jgi:hypothetical protein